MVERKRYSIMVQESRTGGERELLQIDNDPKPIAAKIAAMEIGKGKSRVAKYNCVRIVDHEAT